MTISNRTWLLPAALCSLLAIAGCSGQGTSNGTAARPAPAQPAVAAQPATEAQPTQASAAPPTCALADLGSVFRAGIPGAGNDFATIVLWDKSADTCRLTGVLTVVGLDTADAVVTNPVRYTVPGSGELTPHGTAPAADGTLQAGESVASIVISAEYRDDPTSANGLCTAHQLEPASFRVTLSSGGSLTLANIALATRTEGHDPTSNGGLATCRGKLNTAPDLTHITIGPLD
jgi:hypothetical protein